MDDVLEKISSNIKKKQTVPICANGQRMCIPIFIHDFINQFHSKSDDKKPLNTIGEKASLLYTSCKNKSEIKEAFITSCLIEMLPNFPKGKFLKQSEKWKQRVFDIPGGKRIRVNSALCFYYEINPATHKGARVSLQSFIEKIKKEAERHVMTLGEKRLELIVQESLALYLQSVGVEMKRL